MRDNVSNNTTFIGSFQEAYKVITQSDFLYDIRCIAHIINLIAQDILKEFIISSSDSADLISKYINTEVINLDTYNKEVNNDEYNTI